MSELTVVGIDTSLTATGIARVDTCDLSGAMVTTVTSKAPGTERGPKGKKLPPTLEQRFDRLADLANRIVTVATAGGPTLALVEQPAYASNQGSSHDRSGLWWAVVMRLMYSQIPVAEITPGQRAMYAAGKGNADKDVVLAAVVRRYPGVEVGNNNEADALILAAIGCRKLGHPIEDSLPKANLNAMRIIRWPSGVEQLQRDHSPADAAPF